MTDMLNRANETAQAALRAMNDYHARTGKRNAVEEYQRIEARMDLEEKVAYDAMWAAEQLAPGVAYALPLAVVPRTEDPGDHYAWPA